MDLAACQLFKLLHGGLGVRIGVGADTQGQQHLVGVKTRVVVA